MKKVQVFLSQVFEVYKAASANGDYGGRAPFTTYQAGDPMKLAFTCTSAHLGDSDDDQVTLEKAFEEFNIGEASLAARMYRLRKNRSLSVGDVVVIGDQAYACASFGWDAIDFNVLKLGGGLVV